MQSQDITSLCGAEGRPGPWKTGVNAVDIMQMANWIFIYVIQGHCPPKKRAINFL